MIWVCSCILVSYRINKCVIDDVAGSKIAKSHVLQQCVAVAGLFFQ